MMNTRIPDVLHIGADVAKDEIVVACEEEAFAPRSLVNERDALLVWLKTLPAGSCIGMEATGRYHRLLASVAFELGLAVYVLNPRDCRHYAKGVGLRGNTDRVDARLIARIVAREAGRLRRWAPPSAQQQELDQLLRRRASVSRMRAALVQSLEDLTGFGPERQRPLLQQLAALIACFARRIKTLIEASAERLAAYRRLLGICGVGPVVAAALLNVLERMAFARADAFIAFTGFDPRPDDSGHRRGRRRLTKRGPSELRRLLYLAAMAGARTEAWQPRYQHERAKGLSSTEALVVLARCIARTAWSIYTHKTSFDRARVGHYPSGSESSVPPVRSL